MIQAITDEQTNEMIDEYVKGGKFAQFVNKSCQAYHTSVFQECQKVTVYEYYKSVTSNNGCNKEK